MLDQVVVKSFDHIAFFFQVLDMLNYLAIVLVMRRQTHLSHCATKDLIFAQESREKMQHSTLSN